MKKTGYFTVALFALGSFSLCAQSLALKLANKDFANMRYSEAIVKYEQILKRKNIREAKIKLAESYHKINDVKNELRVYAELAHEENPAPDNIWHYAQALSSNEQYKDAAQWYTFYSLMDPENAFAKKFAETAENISKFYQDSAQYKVKFAASLNSWQSDFSPQYYKNGLVFCSARKEETTIRHVSEYDETPFSDWYFAKDTSSIATEINNESSYYVVNKDDDNHDGNTYLTANDTKIPAHYGVSFLYDSMRYHYTKLTSITRLDNVSQKFHEGPATFFTGQDTVVFTRNTPYQGTARKKTSQQAIYSSIIKNGVWQTPVLLPFNGTDFSSGHPAFTPDNRKLYFVSNRPGGKGGTDLYFVNYDNGVWSKPVNVEELNTRGDEMFPYVDPLGNLYFSTDGMPGLGGLDIFRATVNDGKITGAKNMGVPFNTSKDDFGIIWDKNMRQGYFTSNRKRGYTDDDIYSFHQICQSIAVFAYDSATRMPLDSVAISAGNFEKVTGHDGRVEFCMNPGDHPFEASREKYEGRSLNSEKAYIDMPLNPLHYEIKGIVRSEEDKLPMGDVKIQLVQPNGTVMKELMTGKDGAYQFPLGLNSTYNVVVSKKSCGTNTVIASTVGLKKSAVLKGDATLICTGDIIKVENIYYDLNKYAIRPDAEPELNKLADLMWKYPDMRIELRSHTDSRSSKDFNMSLSTHRAQAAVDYLATKGIVSSRMRAAGYGESLPVNKCVDGVKCTEEEYQQNRRTEFKVLSIK